MDLISEDLRWALEVNAAKGEATWNMSGGRQERLATSILKAEFEYTIEKDSKIKEIKLSNLKNLLYIWTGEYKK